MKQAAFQATVHGFRTVPSRGVISITIECPIEHHAEIARIAEHGAWVAVARLQEPGKEPVKTKPEVVTADTAHTRNWKDLPPAQQAGIRCADPIFQQFLLEEFEFSNDYESAECVRQICGVQSRSELATNHKARTIWHNLDSKFQAWKLVTA